MRAVDIALYSTDFCVVAFAVGLNVFIRRSRIRNRQHLLHMEEMAAHAAREFEQVLRAHSVGRGPPLFRSTEAERRAEGLLFEFLNPAQQTEWLEAGRFTYRSESGNTFIIGDREMAFTQVERRGNVRRRGYHTLWTGLPKADIALCQLLSLMTDEKRVLKAACG